jgi:hypothetical protein
MDTFGLGHGRVAGFCEHDNEIHSTIKGEQFFDQLSDYQVLITFGTSSFSHIQQKSTLCFS